MLHSLLPSTGLQPNVEQRSNAKGSTDANQMTERLSFDTGLSLRGRIVIRYPRGVKFVPEHGPTTKVFASPATHQI